MGSDSVTPTPPPGFNLDQPAASAPPPPPPGFSLDAQAAPAPPAQEPSMMQNIANATSEVEVGKGMAKGVGQTVTGISKLINKIPGIGETLAPQQGTQALEQMSKPSGIAQHIGSGMETILEFAMGDEALQGMSAAMKLKEIAPIAAMLEKFPKLGNALLTGIRQGTVGAAQGTAKTGDVGQGLQEGAITGVTGGAADLGGAALSETVGKSAQQVKNIATDTAERGVSKLGKSAVPARSFGEAADQIEAAAKPTFQKLDELSEGAFSTYQNKIKQASKVIRRATSMEDLEAAEAAKAEAEQSIGRLIDQNAENFQPGELAKAKAAWRDKVVVDKVHDAVEQAFSAPEDMGVGRKLRGNILKTRLNTLVRKMPQEDLDRVLGPQGTKNLYKIADFYATNPNSMKFDGVVGNVMRAAKLARPALIDALITSPRGMDMVQQAIQFGTSPRVYAPLIAAALQSSSPQTKEPQE